jgi:hypothetical protein
MLGERDARDRSPATPSATCTISCTLFRLRYHLIDLSYRSDRKRRVGRVPKIETDAPSSWDSYRRDADKRLPDPPAPPPVPPPHPPLRRDRQIKIDPAFFVYILPRIRNPAEPVARHRFDNDGAPSWGWWDGWTGGRRRATSRTRPVSGSETSGRKIRLVGIRCNREGIGGMTGRAAPEKDDEGPGRDDGGGQGEERGREGGGEGYASDKRKTLGAGGKEARKEAGTERKVERGRRELRTNGPHTDPHTGPVFAVRHTLSDL